MGDMFNEQLVKKLPSKKDLLIRILIVLGAVLVFFIVITISNALLFPAFVIEVFIIVFLFRRMNIEYEYVLTNMELDINKIFNKSSRKKGISVNVKKFVVMVPANRKEFQHDISKFDKAVDYSSGVYNENTYIVIYNDNDKRIKMTIEPNEKIFKAIKTYIPNIVKK